MSVVVLLGCWTAGKTSTINRLQSEWPQKFTVIDSDAAVSEQFGGWLGSVFLAHHADISQAWSYLDFHERLLLARLLIAPQPFLLAAGPLLTTREPFWSVFVTHTNPLCIHLHVTPEEILVGLKKRRKWQKRAGLDLCPGFGAWDEGLVTAYNETKEEWEEIDEAAALCNIRRAQAYLTALYDRFSSHTVAASKLKEDNNLQSAFGALILQHLNAGHHNPSTAVHADAGLRADLLAPRQIRQSAYLIA